MDVQPPCEYRENILACQQWPVRFELDSDDPQLLVKPASDKHPLFMPGAEAMLLHTGIHTTTHLFSHGLKLAFDIHRIRRGYGTIDWDLLAHWANNTRCPRAFWTPLRAMAAGLPEKELPSEFLRHSPSDRQQRRLDLIASKRLFTEMDDADAMNPFSRNAVFLMMYDGMPKRAAYLVDLLTGSAAESRQAALQGSGRQGKSNLKGHLREAQHHWHGYRHAVREARYRTGSK